MRYGEIKKCDIANGEGVRVSLFVSGCTHHCKGCFNEATWDFDYGKEFTQETEEEILKALEPDCQCWEESHLNRRIRECLFRF